MKGRTIFFIVLGILTVWFVFVERAILTPFVLAGIFAYLLNPIISLVTKRFKIPRVVAILLIYGILTTLVVVGSIFLSSQIGTESSELRNFVTKSLQSTEVQIKNLPDWSRPTAYDLLFNLKRSRFLGFLSGQSFFPLFNQVISRIVSFLIFLVSAFYFLKDGEKFFQKVIAFTSSKYKLDIEILFRKINAILSGYLRGQIFLVLLMSLATYIALFILGIRFAFLIAIFSGFAEIVPVVGPIIAAGVAISVVLLTGTIHFGLSPVQGAIALAIIYFILRHLEDYFVIPYVMGRITKLPSFIIFFAVIAGGHLAGILGLILAVPVAAVIRLLLEFSFNQINEKGSRK
ncbi:MAG TPA: AI-2E family transporter [Candidatus Eisenbacteria bacterium]|nr:AI-2E family transporter [Candidatus Eisenbacteria bacterium]